MLPAALLALLAAAPASEARRLVVDERAVAQLADGSEAAPFKTIGAAVRAAREGDTVFVRTGLYAELVVLDKPLTVEGARASVIAAPGPSDTVIEVRAPARLAGLTVQGGAVGVRADAEAALTGVSFSAQRSAAVLANGAPLRVQGGRFAALFDRPQLVGVEAVRAAVRIDGSAFEGPFRFGVRAAGGTLLVDGASFENAVSGVACLDGARCEVRRSVIAQGRGSGLLVSAASMTARDNLISRFEMCVVANPEAELTLEDNATAFCSLTGIAAKQAKLGMKHHVHVGPASTAAVHLLESRTEIDEGLLLDPGETGISLRLGEARVRGTLIRGARADAQGDFGDGVYAYEPAELRLDGVLLEANSGAGLTQLGGASTVSGAEIVASGVAGIAAQKHSSVEVRGTSIRASRGPGVVVSEESTLRLSGSRLDGNGAGGAWVDCASGATVTADATSSRELAPAECIRRR